MADYYRAPPLPSAFIWRRAHSLTGLWLVLFLMEHLFTNSQAALLIGDDGSGFVRAVNFIKELPYLPVIEIVLLAIPFFIHGAWGIRYLLTAQCNSFQSDGTKPSLPQYPRNQAFTWQRITSWILLFGIVGHVVQMRFIDYPSEAVLGTDHYYMVAIKQDEGLYTLSQRMGFDIYNSEQVLAKKKAIPIDPLSLSSAHPTVDELESLQKQSEEKNWLAALTKHPLRADEVVAVTKSFGAAELLVVRDTFKSPLMILLYSGLVLTACFHAFNGLWTFMISWGITLTAASQSLMRAMAVGLMVIISFLGLAAIWGTYWLNLYN